MNDVKAAILDCFDGTEWHLSLWFPRVARQVVGLNAAASDQEIQSALGELIRSGALETGYVDGAQFSACQCSEITLPCPDLYLRSVAVTHC